MLKLRSMVKNKSIHNTVKKEKEVRASFAVAHHIAKVIATMHDKCLDKMEKKLNLWAET